MLWRSRRLFLAVLLSVFLSPIIYFTMDRARVMIEDLNYTNRLVQKSLKNKVEEVTGRSCNIPHLDPLAEDIGNTTENLPIVTCEGTDWVNCYKSECFVAKAILRTVKDIVCGYRDIIYMDDRNVYFGHPFKVIGDENFSLNKSDHVKIDCTGKDMKSPDVPLYWSGLKAGFRPISTEPIPSKHKNLFNVMMLCFDSTSRNGFIRKMRNSYRYLTEKLDAVVLNRYNIVGDGTNGALYPILTGKSEDEHFYQRKRRTKKYINPKKFIFHMLKEHGYRTAYFEDKPWTGTAQYTFNWFRSQPADHYLRAMLLADTRNGENWYQGRPIGHCFGAKPQYQLLMNLADEVLKRVHSESWQR